MKFATNIKECTKCGALYVPDANMSRCPFCGGGWGSVSKTPVQRIKELTTKVEVLELELATLSSNALKRIAELQEKE